jgi:hypothetical protein
MTNAMKTLKILVILSLAILVSCTGNKSQVPASVVNVPNSASGATSEGLPKFEFKTMEHDFGKVIQGERVGFAFKFKNVGEADLVIANISTTCGCTVSEYPKTPVKPGEENVINVTFDSGGKEGFQHKVLTIAANTQPAITEISISALIILPEKRN